MIEDFDVGGGAGAGGLADGGLIDLEAGFDGFFACGFTEGEVGFFDAGGLGFVVEEGGDAGVHERGFPGAGNAGEDGEAAEGDGDVDVF